MLTRELLEKFKSIYQEKFNIALTDEEATLMATDFLNLMKILVSPDSDESPTLDEKKNKILPESPSYETEQI